MIEPTAIGPGRYSKIARELGVSRQTVWSWFQEGRRVPAERVVELEQVSGVPRHKLRPDLFGFTLNKRASA